MCIIRGVEAPTFNMPGFDFIGQTSLSRRAKEISLWRIEALAGASGGLQQLDCEEMFLVLEGALTFNIDGGIFDLIAGDAVSVPACTSLQINNLGEKCTHPIACLLVGAKERKPLVAGNGS